jgi:16S rRNA G1207 methylase RsmC
MRKAVRMWETSQYWTRRADGAVRHAKYKELPAVRARRIKTIEADKRKSEREIAECDRKATAWAKLSDSESVKRDGAPIPFAERVRYVAGLGIGCRYGLGDDLDNGKISAEDAQASVIEELNACKASCKRWVAHFDLRLGYERAMLAASGYVAPPKPKTKAALPLLNYSGEIAYRNPWKRGEIVRSVATGITKAELAAIHTDYKGTRVSECGTHRMRTAMLGRGGDRGLTIVYLTDSKQHERPAPGAPVLETKPRITLRSGRVVVHCEGADGATEAKTLDGEPMADWEWNEYAEAAIKTRAASAGLSRQPREEAAPALQAMREQLKTGVKVVAAPQLFPTPPDLATRMVEEADIQAGDDVLEPSAGTGSILRAIREATVMEMGATISRTAVEINADLCDRLRAADPGTTVVQSDFLTCNGEIGTFDRILMNPPFERGADIAHIKHALRMLKPGGRLVAICAAGPRQREQLAPLGRWEDLPEDTFKSEGTSVRTALLVIRGAIVNGRASKGAL